MIWDIHCAGRSLEGKDGLLILKTGVWTMKSPNLSHKTCILGTCLCSTNCTLEQVLKIRWFWNPVIIFFKSVCSKRFYAWKE